MKKASDGHEPGGLRAGKNGAVVKMIACHIPIELYHELEKRADSEDRTISNQVLRMIRESLSSTK